MAILFSQLAVKFLVWAAKCRKPSTVNVYKHYLRKFVEANGDKEAAAVTPAEVAAWARTWHDVQAVKRLYAWAVDEAFLLERNPIMRMKHPPKGERHRILEARERREIWRASKADLRRLLLALEQSMSRPGEIRLAEWDDLRSEVPCLSVDQALKIGRVSIYLTEFKCRARRKESSVPRVIVLSPLLCRLILWIKRRTNATVGKIFLTRRSRAWTGNALRCRFRRLRKLLGIVRDKRGETIVPYTFRHTAATLAAAAGVRDRVLADVLGHVETKTTARYQHLLIEHLRAALKSAWKR